MEEVKQLTQDAKVATIFKADNGHYLVNFVDGELAVNAGYFYAEETAEAKCNELMNSGYVSADMLRGDVPVEEPVVE